MRPEDIAHIAELSRLDPAPEQLERFARQCADIIGYVDLLSEVDTDGVEPLYTPVEHGAPFRVDMEAAPAPREDVLANAPSTDGEFFIVPRIV